MARHYDLGNLANNSKSGFFAAVKDALVAPSVEYRPAAPKHRRQESNLELRQVAPLPRGLDPQWSEQVRRALQTKIGLSHMFIGKRKTKKGYRPFPIDLTHFMDLVWAIWGNMGSGKTTFARMEFMYLALVNRELKAVGRDDLCFTLVFIDPTFSLENFNHMRACATVQGADFRHWVHAPDVPTHVMPVLEQLADCTDLKFKDVAGLLARAFNFDQGDSESGLYWSTVQTRQLEIPFEKELPLSFEEIIKATKKVTKTVGKGDNRKQIEVEVPIIPHPDVLSTAPGRESHGWLAAYFLHRFADVKTLNITRRNCHEDNLETAYQAGIHWLRSIIKSEVIYLAPNNQTLMGQFMCRLILYTLYYVCRYYRNTYPGNPTHQPANVVVWQDEFARIATASCQDLIEEPRKFGMGMQIGVQSTSSLRRGSTDLGPLITGNANVQLYFSLSDNDYNSLANVTGEKDVYKESGGQTINHGQGDGPTFAERLDWAKDTEPKVKPYEYRAWTAKMGQVIARIDKASGLTRKVAEPILLKLPLHMKSSVMAHFAATDPAQNESTITIDRQENLRYENRTIPPKRRSPLPSLTREQMEKVRVGETEQGFDPFERTT